MVSTLQERTKKRTKLKNNEKLYVYLLKNLLRVTGVSHWHYVACRVQHAYNHHLIKDVRKRKSEVE